MKLSFIFKKDWSGFKSGSYVDGEIKETGNQPPYTINNPMYTVEFSGGAKMPFCYQDTSGPIAEPNVAPWLCNIGKIDLTPAPTQPGAAGGAEDKGDVVPLGKRIFSLRNIIIALVIIVLIGLYLKYGRKK